MTLASPFMVASHGLQRASPRDDAAWNSSNGHLCAPRQGEKRNAASDKADRNSLVQIGSNRRDPQSRCSPPGQQWQLGPQGMGTSVSVAQVSGSYATNSEFAAS